jgi:hypothetical protein
MVWVNGLGIRERRVRSVTPKTDRTTVILFLSLKKERESKEKIFPDRDRRNNRRDKSF